MYSKDRHRGGTLQEFVEYLIQMNRTVNRKFSDGFTNEFYQILKKEIMPSYSIFSENGDKENS